ncbi:Ran GTPase-activating protein 1 [Strongyloides ratti]|uniref:Ran GTPase-activating protein 1 n=1 Tax=Strongyloides ratti TaxID=34506 RepID=A0A090L9R1_STRRB|nr:Ran GTPase-activating protein 1 [Strongyloides ratti]CEF66526.1 Ran GTPase-activating protein 1 [Strongyloides ratti]
MIGKYDSENGKLSFLDLQLKLNTLEDGKNLAIEIEKCPNLVTLELRGNSLGPNAADPIADALKKHKELKRILWSDLFTGRLKTEIPEILEKLLDGITYSGAMLQEIDLSDNALGPVGVEGIKKFLASEAAINLETVKLYNNGLGIGGKTVANCFVECLRKAIQKGKWLNLKTFIAGRNRLENTCAIAFSHAFKMIGTLEDIQIIQNGIWADGIRALADCFRFNPNLRIIDLSDNTCTHRGAVALANVIPKLKELEKIVLGDCLCRDRGSLKIFRAIAKGQLKNLKEIDISGNEVTPKGAIEIDKICKESLKNVNVKLHCNNFSSEFHRLANILKNVNIGDEEDDQGSDVENDELWTPCVNGTEDLPIHIILDFIKAPNSHSLGRVLRRQSDVIDELEDDMRINVNPYTTARFIAALTTAVIPNSKNEKLVSEMLIEILKRGRQIMRSNLPVLMQLSNNLIAFSRLVKSELQEKVPINFDILKNLTGDHVPEFTKYISVW